MEPLLTRNFHLALKSPRVKLIAKSLQEIGYELGHMAEHIGQIEQKMMAKMELAVRSYPGWSAQEDLMRVPVRSPEQYLRTTMPTI